MAINVKCNGCLKRFDVSDKFAGSVGLCPNCETRIPIPVIIEEPEYPEEFDAVMEWIENSRSSSMNNTSQSWLSALMLGLLVILAMGMGFWITSSPDELPGGGDPNLYELARQSAENTRWILVVLLAGGATLFGFYLPVFLHRYTG